ncbi:MAG: 6,7-dimethyl-8-ribityllumazine synthase, partial [Acholeplasmataceae bacterium]|nr:6,7-dimethyl-8-ribityllumazine synthase [Acholeplasmataceae bacterium]
MKTIEGQLKADGLRFGIVAGRFNEFITAKLLSGAIDCLVRHGAKAEDLATAWVPGAFEIP